MKEEFNHFTISPFNHLNNEVVIKTVGCLDTAATAEFMAVVDKAVATGAKIIVFDFTDLSFVASSALRVLVAANKTLKAQEGDVVIKGMNEVVRDVFEVTGLDEVFTIR